jgi:tetratricopeptide (TPR) repeat protein
VSLKGGDVFRVMVMDKVPMSLSAKISPRVIGWTLVVLALVGCIPSYSPATEREVGSLSPSATTGIADPRAYYHFLRGYRNELGNAADAAVVEYEKALLFDPTSVLIHLRAANLYYGKGEYAKAQGHAERALAQDPSHVPAFQLLANVAVATGRPEGAIEYYEKIIALRPQEGQAYFLQGTVYAGLKRYEEAERIIRRGIAVSSVSAPMGYLYLGRIFSEQKAWGQAAQAYRDALAVNPSFEPAYLGLGAALEAQGETAQALAAYRSVLRDVNRGNRDARQRLVRLLLAEKAYEEALGVLREVVAESPEDVEAQLRIGLIYGEMKEQAKAVEQLKLVLALRPHELRVRDHLAYLYEEAKEFDRAIAEYQTIIGTDEQFADAHLHLGYLLYRLKRTEEALPHFRRVIALNPKMSEAYLILGLALLQATRYEEAVSALRDGLTNNPNNADLHFNLGTAYDKMGRFEELVREMEEAIRLDPKHADALNYLGYTYAERDMRLEEAVGLIQRALVIKPQNGYYLDSLAWAYFKMGRFQEALVEMKRAVAVVPDDPVFFEHLGEIYLTHHLLADAREAWLRSLELDPANNKLASRFKAQGFGDPATDDRIRKAQQRLSQN